MTAKFGHTFAEIHINKQTTVGATGIRRREGSCAVKQVSKQEKKTKQKRTDGQTCTGRSNWQQGSRTGVVIWPPPKLCLGETGKG